MSENARQRLWSPDEVELIVACYEWTPTAELAALMDRPPSSVYSLAHKLGLSKAREIKVEMARERMQRPDHPARAHRFRKGSVPANKGVRRPGFAAGRMAETQFKPGRLPSKTMHVGSRRVIEGYSYTKVSAFSYVPYTVNWNLTHILKWERHRGPVPAGHVVVFRDGDRTHIQLRNLELISRAELMRRNTIHNLPEELKEVIRLNGSIKRVITHRRKRHAQEQDVRSAQPPVRDARAAQG